MREFDKNKNKKYIFLKNIKNIKIKSKFYFYIFIFYGANRNQMDKPQ
jgi:hypothetical protein